MKNIAILGLGLMGGSLGLALKASRFSGQVIGYARRPETREEALTRGVVDQVLATPQEAVAEADVVVVCLPVLAIPGMVKLCAASLKSGCLVTDVGSTKQYVTEQVQSILGGSSAVFVGSHPIAGSEQQGLSSARADLYQRAVVVVTPSETNRAKDIENIRQLWVRCGAIVHTMDAATHDRMLARTSHLPHIMAAILVSAVGRAEPLPHLQPFCGPGFRDATRIAEGSSEVWRDIVESNRANLTGELKALRAVLDQVLDWASAGDLEKIQTFLKDARAIRRALLNNLS